MWDNFLRDEEENCSNRCGFIAEYWEYYRGCKEVTMKFLLEMQKNNQKKNTYTYNQKKADENLGTRYEEGGFFL